MNNKQLRANRIWVMIVAILFFSFLASNFAYYVGYQSLQVFKTPEVALEKGVGNYTNYSFNKNIKLNGETLFYWEKLLSPDDFRDSVPANSVLLNIPGIWNGAVINQEKLSGFGYGTYYFKLLTPDNDLYAISVKEFDCAYRMWVNQHEIKAGEVGRSKSEMNPSWRRQTVFFTPENNETHVIIQISNFHHRKGGAEDQMIFGKAKSIIMHKHIQVGVTMLLFGILMVMFFYHIMLFIYRQNDKSLLIFSAICLVFSVRLLSTGEKLIFELFPSISWILSVKLEYLSYKIALPLVLAFVKVIYPNEINKTIYRIVITVASIFCTVVIFAPVSIFSHTPTYYQIFITIVTFYIIYALFRAALRNRPQSIIFLIGFLLFFGIVINDIMYYNKMIDTEFLLPFGIFILIFSQASVISLKSSHAFSQAEMFKNKLEKYNRELEQIVKNRTHEIEMAKNNIEVQAEELKHTNKKLKELSSFKEGMTDMIVHDLKNPLNIVLSYAKEEKVLFAAQQMLNLVHNILDVQRHEFSNMQLNLKPTSIKKLISQALIQVGYLFTERKIVLDNSAHTSALVNVDQGIITRVLVNLLSNALKFTPEHGTVSVNAEILENDKVKVLVTDNGPGIPDDKKNLLFMKFGQIVKKNTGNAESTGIGLAFCKMAIEAHQGEIGFTSEEGKGSTFWFVLQREQQLTETKEIPGYLSQPVARFDPEELSSSDRETLYEWIDQLAECKTYEVTRIKNILANIEKKSSPILNVWLENINQQIWSGNQEGYDQLIDLTKKYTRAVGLKRRSRKK